MTQSILFLLTERPSDQTTDGKLESYERCTAVGSMYVYVLRSAALCARNHGMRCESIELNYLPEILLEFAIKIC